MRVVPVLLLLGVLAPIAARAQGADDALRPDATTCKQTRTAPAAATDVAAPPVTWTDFEVQGSFSDNPATVRALLAPTMQRHRALTDTAREDVQEVAAAFGYYLVGLGTKATPDGTKAIVHLAPLPMVRNVEVDTSLSLSGRLDEEIRRRMRLRTGAYLPWSPSERTCELDAERRRLEEFLADEGYFDASVRIETRSKGTAVVLRVNADLGSGYDTGTVTIAPRAPDAVKDEDIRKKFKHCDLSIPVFRVCIGTARFQRTQHQSDLRAVEQLFRNAGYPGVRVRSTYDRATSADRKKHKVNFTVTIDPRRLVETVFEGYDPDSVDEKALKAQLTFNTAASADDVEAAASAKAIAAYLQERGYFDAHVTWTRERFDAFDHVVFRIDQGEIRRVRSVELVGVHASEPDEAALRGLIATQPAGGLSLFGSAAPPTSLQLAADVDRIVGAYRRAGYRDARVWVTAATDPAALDSASMTAALALAHPGGDLYVRFHVVEGQPTLLAQVRVALSARGDAIATPDDRALCAQVLGDLAALYKDPQLARPAIDGRCVAAAANLKFREGDAATIADQLRDRLFSQGRPRAKVTYAGELLGTRRVVATYTLEDVQALRIGKVIIRGNFRTESSIIRGLLDLPEGAPLTKDRLAAGARALRGSGLFDSVNVAMPDLDNVSEGSVNAVVEVTERYDYKANLLAATGFSTYNGTFVTLAPALRNLGGRGISLELEGTVGFRFLELLENSNFELKQLAAEARLTIPAWLDPTPMKFRYELSAFRRIQDTPRFGQLTTDGVTVALARTWNWPRTPTRAAHAITVSPHYDFRRRERPVDVLRPPGADDDESQVPITTRTGSIGFNFEWEQRVDRSGSLSPLAPEGGFRLEAQVSAAAKVLGGSNNFIKLSGSGSKWWSLGRNLILRADLRYDQGIPIGEVLLPEVERFFAGGDTTVRGYEDDRLATEIIQLGVPPYDNVKQIRILPAGGNIRVMGSLDAQLRIYSVLATGAFLDAGMITNSWATVTEDDIRPAVGIALARLATPFGTLALERAIPLRPQLGDDPRGRWHLSFAARAQF